MLCLALAGQWDGPAFPRHISKARSVWELNATSLWHGTMGTSLYDSYSALLIRSRAACITKPGHPRESQSSPSTCGSFIAVHIDTTYTYDVLMYHLPLAICDVCSARDLVSELCS